MMNAMITTAMDQGRDLERAAASGTVPVTGMEQDPISGLDAAVVMVAVTDQATVKKTEQEAAGTSKTHKSKEKRCKQLTKNRHWAQGQVPAPVMAADAL
jgi:hypothetical protein